MSLWRHLCYFVTIAIGAHWRSCQSTLRLLVVECPGRQMPAQGDVRLELQSSKTVLYPSGPASIALDSSLQYIAYRAQNPSHFPSFEWMQALTGLSWMQVKIILLLEESTERALIQLLDDGNNSPRSQLTLSVLLCESGGKMLQYIYSRGAFLGDSPHPTKGSDQTNLAASTVPASLNSKQSLNHRGKEPVNVNVSSQVQTVAVPKSWKDWDKGTNQPNVELSYEPDPGEIIEREGPVAISSTRSSSTASKPLGS
ncbi:hypothetical protein EV360DRAFT_77274, partial [Lentinula raphanica]